MLCSTCKSPTKNKSYRCSPCQNEYMRMYVRKNPSQAVKMRLRAKKSRELKEFGGFRETAILRDGECVRCGITPVEHIAIFKRAITVDHIDGSGRRSTMENNSLSNLQTLCLRCHGKKDAQRRVWRPVKAGA